MFTLTTVDANYNWENNCVTHEIFIDKTDSRINPKLGKIA